MKESISSCMGWMVCNEDGEETVFSRPFRRRHSSSTTSSTSSGGNHKNHHQQQLMEYYILLEQFQPDFVFENVFKWFNHDEVINSLSHVCRYFRQICTCYLPVHIKYDSHLDESALMNYSKKLNTLRDEDVSLMNENSLMKSLTGKQENPSLGNLYIHDDGDEEFIRNVLSRKSKGFLPFKKVVKYSIIGNPTLVQIPMIESWKQLKSLNVDVHYYSNVSKLSQILDFIFGFEVQQQLTRLDHFKIENTFNLNENTSLNISNVLNMMNMKGMFKIHSITCKIPTFVNDLFKRFQVENLKLGPIFDIDWNLIQNEVCLNSFSCMITSANVQQFQKMVSQDKLHIHQLEIQGSTCLNPHLKTILEIMDRRNFKKIVFHSSIDSKQLFRLLNGQPFLQNSELIFKDPLYIRFNDFQICNFTSRIFSICISIDKEEELHQLIEILKRLPKLALLCLVCGNDQIFSSSKIEFSNDNKLSLSTILMYRRANNLESDNIIGAPKFNFDRFHKISKRKNETEFLREHCNLLDLPFKKSKPYFPYLKIVSL